MHSRPFLTIPRLNARLHSTQAQAATLIGSPRVGGLQSKDWSEDGHDPSQPATASEVPSPGSRKLSRLYTDQPVVPNENIHVNDLEATIRAHREYNAGPKVRRVLVRTQDSALIPAEKDGNSAGRDKIQPLTATGTRENDGKSQQGATLPSTAAQQKIHKEAALQSLHPKINITLNVTDRSVSRPLRLHEWARFSAQHKPKTDNESLLEEGEGAVYKPTAFGPDGNFELDELSDDKYSTWRAHLGDIPAGGFSRLQGEILAFSQYMRLDKQELTAGASVKDLIARYVAKARIGEAQVRLIGSYNNGIASPLSDVDLNIILLDFEKNLLEKGPSPTRPEAVKASRRALLICKKVLEDQPDVWEDVETIHGRIPLVTATHRKTKLTVQIQRQPSSAVLFGEFAFSAFQSEFPTLKPIFRVLKAALAIRGLDKTFTGGLSSYPLLIAIVNALKHYKSKDDLRHDHTEVAKHLLFVLKFYATADLYKTGFRLDHPRVFPKLGYSLGKQPNNRHDEDTEDNDSDERSPEANYDFEGMHQIASPNYKQPYLLCLQDPLNPYNDLGRKAHAIRHIQKLFQVARNRIRAHIHRWEHLPTEERQNPREMMLDILVKGNYKVLERNRALRRGYASAYGASVPGVIRYEKKGPDGTLARRP